jgi:hypothetical protein
MNSDTSFNRVNWQAAFQTSCDERQWVDIPFQDLIPVYRASHIANVPPFDPRHNATFRLLISDKQAGPFRLVI